MKQKMFDKLKNTISNNSVMKIVDTEDTEQSIILNASLFENITFILDLRKPVDIAMLRIEGFLKTEQITNDMAVNQITKEDEGIRVTNYDEKIIFQKTLPYGNEDEDPGDVLIKKTKEFLNIFIDNAEIFECNLDYINENNAKSNDTNNDSNSKEAEDNKTENETEDETEIKDEIEDKQNLSANSEDGIEDEQNLSANSEGESSSDVDNILNELEADYDVLGINAKTENVKISDVDSTLSEKDIDSIYNEINDSLKEKELAVKEREDKLNELAENLKKREDELREKCECIKSVEEYTLEIKKLKMENVKLQNKIDTLIIQKQTLEDDISINDSVSEVAKLKNIIRKQKEVIEKMKGSR